MRMFTIILCFLFSFSSELGASPIMIDRFESPLPIISFLSWLDDTSGNSSIAKASSPEVQNNFFQLHSRFPLIAKGPGWLRLELAKTAPEAGVLPKRDGEDLLLKVGSLPTGTTTIYYQESLDPLKAPEVWFATELKSYESRLLPEPPLSGTTVFIHFEETPSLWFAPLLEKGESAFLLPPDLLLPGLLLCGMVVCLLRALKERTFWPVWASLLLALGIVQIMLPLPLLTRPLSFKDLPAMMAPGLSILIFPHLARLMLRTRNISPSVNAFLKGVTVSGAIISIVPLLHQFNWITRLYPLWPLFLIALLPFCLSALGRRIHGALVLTGLCLLPAIGAGWALGSLFMPEIHPLAEHGGIWGLAISGLFLVFARVPKENISTENEAENESVESISIPEGFPQLSFETSHVSDQTEQNLSHLEEKEIKSESDSSDLETTPSLKTSLERVGQEIPVSDIEEANQTTVAEATQKYSVPSLVNAKPTFEPSTSSPKDNSSSSLHQIKKPLGMSSLFNDTPNNSSPKDSLGKKEEIQESNTLSHKNEGSLQTVSSNLEASVLPEVGEDSEKLPSTDAPLLQNVPSSADKAASTPVKVISLEDDEFSDIEWERQASTIRASMPVGESYLFNLQSLVRDIHNAATPFAEDKDILLSWFISPSLPSILEGDAASLRQALSLLIQNAVQATHKGAVQLFVRHDPASPQSELASLQFTISDTGVAQRADSGFFHAWELAQRTGGSFSIEYSVSGGTLIIFSVKFTLPSDDLLHTHEIKESRNQSELFEETKQPSHSEAFPLTQQILKSMDIRSPEAILESTEEMPIETDMDPLLPKIIITDMTTSNKRLLSHYLSTIPHASIESKSIAHAMELVQRINPAIIIYDADSPEDVILTSVRTIVERRKQQGLPLLPQLVISGHDEQAKRMVEGGATEVLLKPFSQASLLTALSRLLPSLSEIMPSSQSVGNPSSPIVEKDIAPQTATEHKLGQTKKTATPTQSGLQREDDLQKNLSVKGVEEALKHEAKTSSKPTVKVAKDISTELPATTFPSVEIGHTPNRQAAPLVQDLSKEDIIPVASKAKKSEPSTSVSLKDKPLSDKTNTSKKSILVKTDPRSSSLEPLPEKKIPLDETAVEEQIDGQDYAPVNMFAKDDKLVEEEVVNTVQPTTDTQQLNSSDNDKVKDTFDESLDDSKANRSMDDSLHETSTLAEASNTLFEPAPTGNFPLPGIENESIEVVMLPLLPGLINTLEDALADSMKARQEHQTIFVQEAVSRLSSKAEVFGLARLGKIGRCVERAAEADDFEAVDTLLDDLISVTSRYIESLKKCYNSFVNSNR